MRTIVLIFLALAILYVVFSGRWRGVMGALK